MLGPAEEVDVAWDDNSFPSLIHCLNVLGETGTHRCLNKFLVEEQKCREISALVINIKCKTSIYWFSPSCYLPTLYINWVTKPKTQQKHGRRFNLLVLFSWRRRMVCSKWSVSPGGWVLHRHCSLGLLRPRLLFTAWLGGENIIVWCCYRYWTVSRVSYGKSGEWQEGNYWNGEPDVGPGLSSATQPCC